MTNFLLNRMLDPPAKETSTVRCRCFAKACCGRAPLGEVSNQRMSGLDALLLRFSEEGYARDNRITIQHSAPGRPPIANQAISQDLKVHTEYLHTPSGCETIRRAARIGSGAHLKWRPICFRESLPPSTLGNNGSQCVLAQRGSALHATQ